MQEILTAAAALLFLSLILSASLSSSFSFPTFSPSPALAASLAVFGDASASSADSSIHLTRPSGPTSGHLFYTKPLHLLLPTLPRLSSFSTSFSFSLPPSSSDGITFSLLPSPSPSLPLLSVLLSPSPSPSPLNATTTVTIPDAPPLNSALAAGERLRSWIDYHSPSRNLEVRLARSTLPRPLDPLVSHRLNLSGIPDTDLFVSISSASRQNSSQACTVFSWSFALTDHLNSMHSEPLDPHAFLEKTVDPKERRRGGYTCRVLASLLFGVGCAAGIAALVLFLWSAFVDRRMDAAKESPAHAMGFEYKKIVTAAIAKPNVGKK